VGAQRDLLHPGPDQAVKPAAGEERLRGLPQPARLRVVAERAGLLPADLADLEEPSPLPFGVADRMVENVVGVLGLPLGVALGFRVNGRDHVVPMAVEEPSVIAAATRSARLVRAAGGFTASADPPRMIGQIQLVRVPDPAAGVARLEAAAERLAAAADAIHPNMVRRGGGVRGVQVRLLEETPCGPMLVVHLLVDVGDAMGANAVNTMVEAVAPLAEAASGGRARLRILSNLADHRLARAEARIPFPLLATPALDGAEVASRIVEAWALADADPYRAATHNKGIMNGVDAVVVATGNDWRAVEAGAHAYAARAGRYGPLSRWTIEDGALAGRLELPLAVATVGGHLELNPRVRLALRVLGVESARDLAAVIAAVGLGQNLAALRALVTDGIQRGHMALHARGLAAAAGAPADLCGAVTERLIASGEIKLTKAREILAALQGEAR
jgi:hydroxymethylglutaryl-CoA reductase